MQQQSSRQRSEGHINDSELGSAVITINNMDHDAVRTMRIRRFHAPTPEGIAYKRHGETQDEAPRKSKPTHTVDP